MHSEGPFHIEPLVDCVFIALFGDPNRPNILLEFLNAVVQPEVPIVGVAVQNPRQGPAFIGDDLTVLDVEAIDSEGRTYQVEMQNWNQTGLRNRMLYDWAGLYEKQLQAGDPWEKLRPVISIWVLNQNIMRYAPRVHHCFTVSDVGAKMTLSDHFQIHTIELEKWREHGPGAGPALQKWLRFLTEAKEWRRVPEDLSSPGMEDAMGVLERFAKNAQWNSTYRAREEYQRNEISRALELEQLQEEKERARAAEAEARAAEAEARAAEAQARAAEAQARAAEVQARTENERERAEKEVALAEIQRLEAEMAALRALNSGRAGGLKDTDHR
jgi:predicted transposase/invertase (TIGR01784 family)